MKRTLVAAAAAAVLALGGIVTAAPAVAEPRCLFQGDWNCYGPPQYNGPLQNTWDARLDARCRSSARAAPAMQPCQLYVPQP